MGLLLSTSSHQGLALTLDSTKSKAIEVGCWASLSWRCAK